MTDSQKLCNRPVFFTFRFKLKSSHWFLTLLHFFLFLNRDREAKLESAHYSDIWFCNLWHSILQNVWVEWHLDGNKYEMIIENELTHQLFCQFLDASLFPSLNSCLLNNITFLTDNYGHRFMLIKVLPDQFYERSQKV